MKAKVIAIQKRCCEGIGSADTAPRLQRQIADRAFEFWLERGFRNGSPQEDWLHAQQEFAPARMLTAAIDT
jgi:hypothetical protein